ncbi:DNA methyltransferase, partial [Methanocalculus sp.]|uniref:site-specific DNA-methyltransferase n=1 Tax=Methanocalculus sp. TaxID=2004547 RepID=UPI00260489CD
LADQAFGDNNFISTVIWQKVFSPKNSARHFSVDHEYILVYAKDANAWLPNLLPRSIEADARYTNPDNDPRGPWSSSDLTGRNYYSEGEYDVTSPDGTKFEPPRGRYWVVKKEKFLQLDAEDRIWWGVNEGNMPRLKRFLSEVKQGIVPQTLWSYKTVGHTQEAKRDILSTMAVNHPSEVFTTPKPVRLISHIFKIGMSSGSNIIALDFFAGSGTSAHAILNLNKSDSGKRKYLLVEIGDYFDTIMKPRIQKVMFSSNWKDDKPESNDGQSHIFKYMELEQYEDTLNNIEFLDRDGHVQATIFGMNDYMLRYFLDVETRESPCRLNVDRLATPFAYTLRVRRETGFDDVPADEDGFREVTADLVETFNYLLGLHVKRRVVRYHGDLTYRIVHGVLPDGKITAIVWRNSPKDPAGHEQSLETDATFITDEILREFPDTVTLYVNGHCFAPRATRIEPEFKKRMGA